MVLFSLISNISASDIENDIYQQQFFENNISNTEDIPDTPDLIEKKINDVTPTNIDLYFKNGSLNKNYDNETFIFSGNFDNLGVLTFNSNNINITGNNAYFKNTAFNIEANNVILNNISFTSNKEINNNCGAVILIGGDDITLSNLNINFTVPSNVEAYGILVDGYDGYSASDLKISNSTINFEGHNDNIDIYNCPIKLTCVDSLIIENNIINASFPLKNINYNIQDSILNSNYVYAIGLEECNDFIIINNTIISNVNKRPHIEYPSLNCVMLTKSDYGLFANNTIYMTDFITSMGVENYLYGLDMHEINNILVIENNITIITSGGKLALGTAYPIQISGPASSINITKNYLYSFSNGPNIGIYSQNYYGLTDISMTYNIINITGLAGTHEWALVTGIESQDTSSEIMNNIIEVHSVNSVSRNDNLYAISYRQSTSGSHTFNIQNNLAFGNGYYAVHLLSSDNSTITNNTLVSSNDNVKTGEDAYSKGSRGHNDNQVNDNVVFKLIDYYKTSSISVEDVSYLNYNSNINGDSISWSNQNSQTIPANNPLIPYYSNNKPIPENTQTANNNITQKDDYIDDGSIQGSINDFNSNTQENSKNNEEYAEVIGKWDVDGLNVNTLTNNSKSTPSAGGSNSPLSISQSVHETGKSQSVSKKVYEIEEKIKNKKEFIPSVFITVIVLILLIVGYKRKKIVY